MSNQRTSAKLADFMRTGLRGLYVLCAATLPVAANADAKLAEVQMALNTWQIYEGPANGVWTPETEAALQIFLTHRGIQFDGEFGQDDYEEVIGQVEFELPQADGLSLCQPEGFPSVDSYSLSATDRSEFSLRLGKGDFDRADYRHQVAVYDSSKQNFNRQRAEVVSCEWLSPGQIYTLDFDVRVSHVSAGTFFQISSGDPDGALGLGAFPGSLRVDLGTTITMRSTFRGDYLDEWTKVRVVFLPDSGDKMFFRFYVNGKLGFEAGNNSARFGYSSKGALLSFGPYRGKSSMEASVGFKNIVLVEGDLGQPDL